MMYTDLSKFNVQVEPCRTCPFEGKNPIQLESERYSELIKNLAGEGQHLCHSVNNKMICRGGRNIQLRLLCASGLLKKPTDECFNDAVNKYTKN